MEACMALIRAAMSVAAGAGGGGGAGGNVGAELDVEDAGTKENLGGGREREKGLTCELLGVAPAAAVAADVYAGKRAFKVVKGV